jgi:hypothetical protein
VLQKTTCGAGHVRTRLELAFDTRRAVFSYEASRGALLEGVVSELQLAAYRPISRLRVLLSPIFAEPGSELSG